MKQVSVLADQLRLEDGFELSVVKQIRCFDNGWNWAKSTAVQVLCLLTLAMKNGVRFHRNPLS